MVRAIGPQGSNRSHSAPDAAGEAGLVTCGNRKVPPTSQEKRECHESRASTAGGTFLLGEGLT